MGGEGSVCGTEEEVCLGGSREIAAGFSVFDLFFGEEAG